MMSSIEKKAAFIQAKTKSKLHWEEIWHFKQKLGGQVEEQKKVKTDYSLLPCIKKNTKCFPSLRHGQT